MGGRAWIERSEGRPGNTAARGGQVGSASRPVGGRGIYRRRIEITRRQRQRVFEFVPR